MVASSALVAASAPAEPVLMPAHDPRKGSARDSRAGVVRDLRERMRELQPALFPARELPTHPALSVLLPGGSLRAGGVYVVAGSYSVALTALAAVSRRQWVAAVGFPHLGVEAAAELGVDVDRLILIPSPGQRWVPVVAALIDTVGVVLLRLPQGVDEATASRLASRLRQRESALVVVGEWPHPEARVVAGARRWMGLGAGWGRLAECGFSVTTSDRLGHATVAGCVLRGDGMIAGSVAAGVRAAVPAVPSAAVLGRES